jgi:ATP adenylyltransferase
MDDSRGGAGRADILWAPWRMEYIESAEKPDGCIFCAKPDETRDRGNLIVHRGVLTFVIMNRFPYNNGHLMVVPFRHTADLSDLDRRERDELFDLLIESRRILTDLMRPHGFNIGMNLGRTAGAGVEHHLHFHIVPRWNGDTNFMPVVGHTKVVSEALDATWTKLAEAFKKWNEDDADGNGSPRIKNDM